VNRYRLEHAEHRAAGDGRVVAMPDHFPRTVLAEFVIMPNHVHGIGWIVDTATDAVCNVGNVCPG
jgi:hypothetical protein